MIYTGYLRMYLYTLSKIYNFILCKHSCISKSKSIWFTYMCNRPLMYLTSIRQSCQSLFQRTFGAQRQQKLRKHMTLQRIRKIDKSKLSCQRLGQWRCPSSETQWHPSWSARAPTSVPKNCAVFAKCCGILRQKARYPSCVGKVRGIAKFHCPCRFWYWKSPAAPPARNIWLPAETAETQDIHAYSSWCNMMQVNPRNGLQLTDAKFQLMSHEV